jgi:thiol:disulfide interchange protein DsbA
MKNLILMVLVLAAVQSTMGQEFRLGRHYQLLPTPMETRNSEMIEVVEVFHYGCVHCFNFDPVLEKWREQQHRDVQFRRLPAIWNETLRMWAQAYFAAEVLSVIDAVHYPIFKAIHTYGVDLRDLTVIGKLFEEVAEVDLAEFSRVYNSFSVRVRVQQAEAQGRIYEVSGVPTMIVNGKYRVDTMMAGNTKKMLQVVDHLVELERELVSIE